MARSVILCVIFFFTFVRGFYVQPDVSFLVEHPQSQHVVAGYNFSLSCGLKVKGLTDEEGGLNVPIVHWLFNSTAITDIFPEAIDVEELTGDQYLRSTLHVRNASLTHTGIYSCNVVDGTDEGGRARSFAHLCDMHDCMPFTTSSHPATVTILGNVMYEPIEVEKDRCSSVLLKCGSLYTERGSLGPQIQWKHDTIVLNKSSSWYEALDIGDLVLYDSDDSALSSLYQCISYSGNGISTVLASYTLIEGSESGSSFPGESIKLSTMPSSEIVEGESFSVYLSLSSVCQENGSLTCKLWTMNNSSLCSNIPDENDTVPQDIDFSCSGRTLRIKKASLERDSGRYCCEFYNGNSVCIDINITTAARPVIFAPQNGSTLTTDHPSPLLLTCTPSNPSNTTISWIFNGVLQSHLRGLEEVPLNVTNTSTGVYQCLAANTFGYSIANLRIVPHGLTNPPGVTKFIREVPRPDSRHRPAYLFSWLAPSYPNSLDSESFKYFLPTNQGSIFSRNNSTVIFLPRGSYVSLIVSVVDSTTNQTLSEVSPPSPFQILESVCTRYVYFPPILTANCGSGEVNLTWTNHPDNMRYYPKGFYSENGPIPELYFINITCYTPNNTVMEINEVFAEESSAIFDLEQLAIGTECILKGAATPETSDHPFCIDPANVLYNSTNCSTTGFVEFENVSYTAREGEGKEICMTTRGTGYIFQLEAIHPDNTTEEWMVEVESSGRQCVMLEVEDDEVVNDEHSVTLLQLSCDDSRVSTGPPSILTIFNDDIAEVYFTNTSYVVKEGDAISVCVAADRELQIPVTIGLSTDQSTDGRLDVPDSLTLGPNNSVVCVLISSHDNGNVDKDHTYQLILTSRSEQNFVTTPSSASLTIMNDDTIQVEFTRDEYRVKAGDQLDVCVRNIASGDLEKRISITLNLSTISDGGARVNAELDWTSIELTTANHTSCVLLNTSSSGSTQRSATALLSLALTSDDRDVHFLRRETFITVELPFLPTNSASSAVTVISVVSTIVLAGVLSVTIIGIILFYLHRKRNGYFNTQIRLPEGPLERKEYVPRNIEYGSMSTIYDGVVEPSIKELKEAKKERDASSGISMSHSNLCSETEVLVSKDKVNQERVKGDGMLLDKKEKEPEHISSEQQSSGLSLDNDKDSPCQSGSSISQHEYIASDSIMGLVGGASSEAHHSSRDNSKNFLSDTIVLSEISNGRDKDSGIDT